MSLLATSSQLSVPSSRSSFHLSPLSTSLSHTHKNTHKIQIAVSFETLIDDCKAIIGMRISEVSQSPENISKVLHSNSSPNFSPHLPHDANSHRRTRWRNEFPATSLLGKKLRKPNDQMPFRRLKANEETNSVSARKLAASLWKLTAAEVLITSGGGGGGDGGIIRYEWFDTLQFQPAGGTMRFPSYLFSRNHGSEIKSWLKNPLLDLCPKHGGVFKDKSSLSFSELPLEGATKWDLVHRNISAGASCHLTCKKNSKNQVVALNEEKTSLVRRERQKLHVMIDDLKNELKRERRGCKRVQIANSQLLNNIVNAKTAVKEIIQNYEKERKTRELVEKTCHELAKKIEEDKIKMEDIKRKSLKLSEQLEVERKMLQMADILREERVKIKMAEAKLILEEKFGQLNNLLADLEDFLRSKDESLDMIEISEGEVIRQAVKSADIKETTDLLCSTIQDHQKNKVRNTERNQSVEMKSTEKIISKTSILTGHESLKLEISDMCSAIIAKKVIKKPSTINWQLRSPRRDCNIDKIITVMGRGRFGNRTKAPKMGRVTPADTVQVGNPHITRAMKGCLEWPQGMSKNGLKGRLLDSRYGVNRSENLVA